MAGIVSPVPVNQIGDARPAAGGAVIADYGLGTYDGHGRTASADHVAELLGISRKNGQVVPGQLTFEGLQTRLQLQDDTTAATTAKVLGRIDKYPAIFLREIGKGKIIYANFLFNQYPSLKNSYRDNCLYQKLLRKLLRHAGIASFPVLLSQQDGQEPHCSRIFRFRSGEIDYLGLLQELHSETKFNRLKINLERSCHIYNVRKRKYLGRQQQFELELSPGEAAFFSLLPEQAAAPTIALNPKAVPAGAEVNCQIGLPDSRDASPTQRVIRLEILSPDGQICKPYSRNLAAANGQFSHSFSTAFSDQPGQWQVRAIDLSSGLTTVTGLTISKD